MEVETLRSFVSTKEKKEKKSHVIFSESSALSCDFLFMFCPFLREATSILPFDRGSDRSAGQLIGLTWFSAGINVVVDCVAFVELTRESRAVLLEWIWISAQLKNDSALTLHSDVHVKLFRLKVAPMFYIHMRQTDFLHGLIRKIHNCSFPYMYHPIVPPLNKNKGIVNVQDTWPTSSAINPSSLRYF